MSLKSSCSSSDQYLDTTAIVRENAIPVLHEIRHALEQLLTTGESTTIDLSNLPMGNIDRQLLFDALGSGEITADLDVLGNTHITATGQPGVWLIEQFGNDGLPTQTFIEIAYAPSIIAASQENIIEGFEKLETDLFEMKSQ